MALLFVDVGQYEEAARPTKQHVRRDTTHIPDFHGHVVSYFEDRAYSNRLMRRRLGFRWIPPRKKKTVQVSFRQLAFKQGVRFSVSRFLSHGHVSRTPERSVPRSEPKQLKLPVTDIIIRGKSSVTFSETVYTTKEHRGAPRWTLAENWLKE